MIVGSLDQADFPWEDVDLTTAGLQDFARTGSTLDWNLGISISSARGGPGPFDTTVTVTLASGLPLLHADTDPPGSGCAQLAHPAGGAVSGPTVTDGPDGQVLVWNLADRRRPTPTTRCRSAPRPASRSARQPLARKVEIANGTAIDCRRRRRRRHRRRVG